MVQLVAAADLLLLLLLVGFFTKLEVNRSPSVARSVGPRWGPIGGGRSPDLPKEPWGGYANALYAGGSEALGKPPCRTG